MKEGVDYKLLCKQLQGKVDAGMEAGAYTPPLFSST